MNVQNIAESSGYYHSLLQPLAGEHPCGQSLEYDPSFLMLLASLQPKLTAEYGNFVEAAESINWTDCERKCSELLAKSRDVRLIIILMRCRLRQIGVRAVEEGLEALTWCLTTWPNELQPQLFDEGEFEPFMRANAFAELEDIDGFIADLRHQSLPKAAGQHITVKEFEKAHSFPREEGALETSTLDAIKHDWQARAESAILSLQKAYALLLTIKASLSNTLGADIAPDFARLPSLLCHFGTADTAAPAALFEVSHSINELTSPEPTLEVSHIPAAEPLNSVMVSVPGDNTAPIHLPFTPPSPPPLPAAQPAKGIQNRAEALLRIKEIRQWFEAMEPSSPVGALLNLSEKTVGRSYVELQQIMPQELIAKLNDGQE